MLTGALRAAGIGTEAVVEHVGTWNDKHMLAKKCITGQKVHQSARFIVGEVIMPKPRGVSGVGRTENGKRMQPASNPRSQNKTVLPICSVNEGTKSFGLSLGRAPYSSDMIGCISSRPQKISLRVWSSINNEYICCVARPMLVTEWPVVSRKSEREKR